MRGSMTSMNWKSCFCGILTGSVCPRTRGWSLELEKETRLKPEQLIPVEAKGERSAHQWEEGWA